MRLVWGLDRQVADFVAAQFPLVVERGGFKHAKAVGLADDNDVLVGGLAVSEYRGHDAELSIYLAKYNGLTRGLIRDVFDWAFNELKVLRLTCKIAKRNKRSRRLAEGMGFRLEGTMKLGFDNGTDDQCIYGMTRHDCKWIGK